MTTPASGLRRTVIWAGYSCDSATPGVGRHQRQADQWAARFLATFIARWHKPVIRLLGCPIEATLGSAMPISRSHPDGPDRM